MILWLSVRCPIHILAVLCNWYPFSWILSKDLSLMMLLGISFILLLQDWPHIEQTSHFTSFGFGLWTALDILEWRSLPRSLHNLSVRCPQYSPAHAHTHTQRCQPFSTSPSTQPHALVSLYHSSFCLFPPPCAETGRGAWSLYTPPDICHTPKAQPRVYWLVILLTYNLPNF